MGFTLLLHKSTTPLKDAQVDGSRFCCKATVKHLSKTRGKRIFLYIVFIPLQVSMLNFPILRMFNQIINFRSAEIARCCVRMHGFCGHISMLVACQG